MSSRTDTLPRIAHIGVVGGGLMGSGIAESAALAEVQVTVYEPELAPLGRSRRRLAESVERAVTRGNLSRGDAEALTARITYTTELEGLAEVDAVLEAVTEDPRVKGQLF